MPRAPRNLQSGHVYHVINRGNGKARVFHKPGDYEAFLNILAGAKQRQPIKLFAFCLMPNHFHLVVEPKSSLALSRFMQWVMTSHVRRYHRHYEGQRAYLTGPLQEFCHPAGRASNHGSSLRLSESGPRRASEEIR